MVAFKPALAYGVVTPMFDAITALLGFGEQFAGEGARRAEVGAGESVLDLGCGTGRLLTALVEQQPAARYVGLDPDPRILRIARRRLTQLGGNVELTEEYSQRLPLSDDVFDLVVSTLVFHDLPDDAKRAALPEVAWVLRPGRRFLLVDFGRPQTGLSRAVLMLGSLFDGRANMRTNLAGELPAILRAAGFDVADVRRPYREVGYLLARPEAAPPGAIPHRGIY